MHACVYVCMHVNTHVHVFMCACHLDMEAKITVIALQRIQSFDSCHLCVCAFVNTRMCVCVYKCLRIYLYVCVSVCVCVCIAA